MADNKKYYYLKLKENFFDSDEMILLESQKDGHIYSNILLKLYLRSLKNGGKLMFKDRIPYNAEILSTVVRQPVAVVEKALHLFHQLGLIEILDNGAIYMMDIQNFIGQSSTEADRIRGYRNRIESEKQKLLPNSSVQMYDKSTPEIEIEKEIEIDIEKEEKKDVPDTNVGNTRALSKNTRVSSKHIHGEHKKVRLTDDELQKLKAEHQNADELIQFLDEYKAMTGKVYKSDYLAIKKWVVSAVEERKRKNTRPQQTSRRVAEMPSYMTEKPKEQSADETLDLIRESYKLAVTFGMTQKADAEKQKYFELTGRDISQEIGELKTLEE